MSADLNAKLAQAQQHLKEGNAEKARVLLARLLPRAGNHPAVNQLMCLASVSLMQYDQAAYYAQRAADAAPGTADLQVNLGNCLIFTARAEQAVDAYRKALDIDPAHLGGRQGLAHALHDSGQLIEAAEHLRSILYSHPSDAKSALALGTILCDIGRAPEAAVILAAAIQRNPNRLDLLSSYASTLNYDDHHTPEEVFAAHKSYGDTLRILVAGRNVFTHRTTDDPDRPLRVGILSPDLRNHSVSFFAHSLLEWLPQAAPGKFHLTAYYNHYEEDQTSAQLKTLFDRWRHVRRMNDLELSKAIAGDSIDILFELAGHTMGERFPALQLGPAPVQITCIGYPHTTGVSAVHARIVDSHTDPSPDADRFATERLVRIDPCFLCYRPYEHAPEPSPAPCLSSGRVTFGSFNAISKLSATTVQLWTRLLAENAGSTLILKATALRDPRVQDEIRQRFESAGMDTARIELLPPNSERADHLALYSRIDLALDPFPYHGTTTTCEAFHMGLPVLTLAGSSHASRVGVSLLLAVGLPELIARTQDDYIRIASELARDPQRLADLRRTMRERLLSSPLCDGPSYGSRLAGALRELWRARCTPHA